MTTNLQDRMWVCYPPPGSGLPRKRVAAPSRAVAVLRLSRWFNANMPRYAYASTNYVIRTVDEPAPY